MNGIGVGGAVGLGAVIGLRIVSPGAESLEYVASFVVYGSLVGFTFQLWKIALEDWKPPFTRRR